MLLPYRQETFAKSLCDRIPCVVKLNRLCDHDYKIPVFTFLLLSVNHGLVLIFEAQW